MSIEKADRDPWRERHFKINTFMFPVDLRGRILSFALSRFFFLRFPLLEKNEYRSVLGESEWIKLSSSFIITLQLESPHLQNVVVGL